MKSYKCYKSMQGRAFASSLETWLLHRIPILSEFQFHPVFKPRSLHLQLRCVTIHVICPHRSQRVVSSFDVMTHVKSSE